ncbi:MAG TPA: dTDP-4-dehydrorhamnose reductase [Rhodospirillaceae bacterium]|nr:dTDP-4-dehydrorhamnose reductase [Rhodospirillaceae bacterium]
MQQRRVLVTGASGQVGGAFKIAGPRLGLSILAPDRSAFDLSRPQELAAALDHFQPDILVNCAAYTAVDQAESEAELAYRINAEAPRQMALWCGRNHRPLIQLSTDYVFAGDGHRPYREEDPVAPVSIYGKSKEEGERWVRQGCPDHIILRTAWVYAAQGKNFVKTMLRLGKDRPHLNVVADQRGCPTAAHNIAEGLGRIIACLAKGRADLFGTYHYVDDGETTWHGFAQAIFAEAAKRWGHGPEVSPITTDQYPTPARRPAYSVLDTNKLRNAFALTPPCWRESLALVMAEMMDEPAGSLSPAQKK